MASPPVRAFVALELPDPIRSEVAALIARAQQQAPVPLPWVAAEKLHLTLAFLGACASAALARLEGTLAQRLAGHRPVALALGGPGLFPGPQRPAVLWVGIDGEGLAALQGAVAGACREAGLPLEDRPFVAHLTCARVRTRGPPGALAAFWSAQRVPRAGWVQQQVSLMRSDPGPGGTVYRATSRVALDG